MQRELVIQYSIIFFTPGRIKHRLFIKNKKKQTKRKTKTDKQEEHRMRVGEVSGVQEGLIDGHDFFSVASGERESTN